MKVSVIRLSVATALAGLNALGQTSATIDIDAAHTTALNANFSGFNDEVTFPIEYFDCRFNNLAARLSPGWVYPSGNFADAFNWQTGLMVPSWVAQFQGANIASLLTESVPWVNGKGGGSFVDAANRANFPGRSPRRIIFRWRCGSFPTSHISTNSSSLRAPARW